MAKNLTTISVPDDLHRRLRLGSSSEGCSAHRFLELLLKQEPEGAIKRKAPRLYKSAINISYESRDKLKLRAIETRVPMWCHVEALLDQYTGVAVDPLLG